MRTPMQELIDMFQYMRENGDNDLRTVIYITTQALEKEKKMIVDAWWNGHDERAAAGMVHVPENAPELYYNEKYSDK